MTRYWWLTSCLAAAFLLVFLTAETLGWSLEDPETILTSAGSAAALMSIGLLTIDSFAPVPASLVMLANGWLFGAALGILISTIGAMLSFLVTFEIGRQNAQRLADAVGPESCRRANALMARHGAVAIAISRPVPIVAETVAVLAGASALSWRRALLGAATGVVPQAVMYGLVGSVIDSFASGAIVFFAVVVMSALLWLALPGIPAVPHPAHVRTPRQTR